MSWRVLITVKAWLYVSLIFADSSFKCKITVEEVVMCLCVNNPCFVDNSSSGQYCAISVEIKCGTKDDICKRCESIDKKCSKSSSSNLSLWGTNWNWNCLLRDSSSCNVVCVDGTSLSMPVTTTSTIPSTSDSDSLSSTSRSSSSKTKITTITSTQQEEKSSTTGNQSEQQNSTTGNQSEQEPSTAEYYHERENSKGLIIGVVIGGVLGIALLAGLVLFIIFRRRRLRFTSSKKDNSATTSNEISGYGSLNYANSATPTPYDNIGSSPVSATTSNEASGYGSLNYVRRAPHAPYDNIGSSHVSIYPPLHAESNSDNVKVLQKQDSDKGFGNIEMEKNSDQVAHYEEATKISDNTRNAYETVAAHNQLYGGHAMKTSSAKPYETETVLIENDIYQH